jgi:hypothetical protein
MKGSIDRAYRAHLSRPQRFGERELSYRGDRGAGMPQKLGLNLSRN